MTAQPSPRGERRPELDALRALVVVGLVFFHSSLVFEPGGDFYVTNAETTELTTIFAALCVVWAMPLLFLVSGLGAWHSLRRRGAGGFAVERLRRLGVPLVFATLVLLPFPQWLRLRADPAYHDSYHGSGRTSSRYGWSRRSSRSSCRAPSTRPATSGSWCCCWSTRCCWRRSPAGCRPVSAGGSATGWSRRPGGAARCCCCPPRRSPSSPPCWGWRRTTAAGAGGRTCCSSCSGSRSRPTRDCARRCAATRWWRRCSG